MGWLLATDVRVDGDAAVVEGQEAPGATGGLWGFVPHGRAGREVDVGTWAALRSYRPSHGLEIPGSSRLPDVTDRRAIRHRRRQAGFFSMVAPVRRPMIGRRPRTNGGAMMDHVQISIGSGRLAILAGVALLGTLSAGPIHAAAEEEPSSPPPQGE